MKIRSSFGFSISTVVRVACDLVVRINDSQKRALNLGSKMLTVIKLEPALISKIFVKYKITILALDLSAEKKS